MSAGVKDYNETDFPTSKTHTIRLHCVRIHDIKDDFKLKVNFGNDIKLTFNEGKQLCSKDNLVPFVYTLDLNLKTDESKQLYVYHKNSFKRIDKYHLVISRPRPVTIYPKISHQENPGQEHKLSNNLENPYHFLFSIHFSKATMMTPPGINTTYFDDLCLFTYYLLQNQIHHLFDILTAQFHASLANDNGTFDKIKYNNFFETCNLYMGDISISLETDLTTLKIILRMIGLLPIEKQNFDRYSPDANEFAVKVMSQVRQRFDSLLQQINKDEQLLFRSDLARLLCIELLYSTSDDAGDNKLRFICQISDEKQRQEIANEILMELYKFNEPICANSTWIDLFLVVNWNMIKLQDVYLINSFETYIMFITKVSAVYPDNNHFYNKISEEFDRLMYHDNLQVDLESILFLIKFTQHRLTYDHNATNRLLSEIRRRIETDEPLKYKIAVYFDNLKVTNENLENIGYIFGLKSKCRFLDNVRKDVLLRRSLTKDNSHDYYIKWFKCFLANSQAQYGDNHEQCKELLQVWTDCFENDYSKFRKVLMAIDELLHSVEESADNFWLHSYFIDHTVHLCFRQEDIFRIIVDGLLRVENEKFRVQFKNMFDNKYLNNERQKLFEKLTNNTSIFSKLIGFNEKEASQSMLVRDLIQLICDNVEVTKDDLMHDTFNEPTKFTSTYAILSTISLRTSPLYQKIIEQLTLLWKEWETDGFKVDEIKTWNKLKKGQQQDACDIWHVFGASTGKTIRFDQLIDKTNRKMRMIMTLTANIATCIKNYCQEACDKPYYYNILERMDTQLNQKKVLSIQVPKEIEKLKPFADRLNPAFSSLVWQQYLKDNLEPKKLQCNAVDNEQQTTCLLILKQTEEILNQFNTRLVALCTDTKQPLLPQLEQLFPQKCLIDHEFSVLKTLLDDNIMSQLEILLDYWKNRERINHIWKGCKNMVVQYKISVSDKLSVLQNTFDLNDQTSGETCIAVYQDYCNHYSNQYSKAMLDLIVQWSLSDELLQFLYSLTMPAVDDLLEVVNDWDETLINTKTVLDFVYLKRFFDKVDVMIESVRLRKFLDLHDIITCFQEVYDEVELQNVLISINACSKSLFSIQRIHEDSTNKQQSKRRRILDIMQKIHFCFHTRQSKDTFNANKYQFDIHAVNDSLESICFDDLSELRDRARLIVYANNNSYQLEHYTEDDIHQLRLFVSFVEMIETILKSLTSLNTAGYPVIQQLLTPNKQFLCSKDNFDKLDEFKSILEVQLVQWESYLCSMYERCVDLTYFSYQQVWIVEDFLYNRIALATDNLGYHLLKFVGIDPQNIPSELLPIRSEKINDRLHDMAKILNTQRINRNSPLQEDEQRYKKIFLVETSSKGILRAICYLFQLNNAPVIANQLFYCTTDTNWMEIRAFIYRCFHSQKFHQLIRPELLSLVIQDQFVQLFNQLLEQNPKHLFLLGIITTIPSAHLRLVNGFKTHRIMQTIHDQDMLNGTAMETTILQLINNKCTLVTSRIAGLGKSTYIQKEILRLRKNHVKFPISGDVNIDTLMERLRDQQIQSVPSTIVIHVDIGPVQNVEQLNEFLYSLILFRCFRLGEVPVHVSVDIPIYIELDASLYLNHLQDDISIFKYLKTKHFDYIDWNELDSINSPAIQFVSNYLNAIENQTIIAKDINEETLTTLDKQTCIHLLQKHFLKKDTDFISWTQLSIFISVYYKLFSGFSKCAYFLVDPDDHSSLRLDLLENLLNSSDQFTTLSVETVRKNQRLVDDSNTSVSFSEAIIRWDKSQPFTFILTATHDALFVYKTVNDIPPSLIDAFRFYYQLVNKKLIVKNTHQRSAFSWIKRRFFTSNIAEVTLPTKSPEEQLQEFLIDPNQMTHEQFFLRLTLLSTKYLTLKSICMRCFKQYKYNEQQCANCSTKDLLIQPSSSVENQDIEDFQKIVAKKLLSDYVLTADNYLKMLLIYLRVQSNLPVLIMGETGCGKTALIQCLCQKILDDEMLIFRIHAGLTSEKIIETMRAFSKKANEWAEEDKNKRLWVFLDEFNTTQSIGLLKEIVCDRTLLGEALPKNIVLLGACNPQRRKKNKELDDHIGIKKYYSEIQRHTSSVDPSLLYSVVPIPETMLEHIWDYGHLDEATEKSYIMTMLNTCEQLTTNQAWFNCIVNLISESQKYFREREDVSSVSLRDISRFCLFYNWFHKSATSYEDQQIPTLHSFNSMERASLLALFLCYYFRLNSSTKREDYMKIIGDSIKTSKPEISLGSLNTLLENEKMALVDRMELPAGTAKNRALTDNIFVLFTCILNRISVILCGKPGSSKTSAVQIVISNLKGKKSKDEFFQTLPGLVAVSYQGSQNCTSESIIKVFAQADKCKEAKNDAELLPVIVFDEIGLAELSSHNPLKVLHSELEIETCRHGFVGLSNWRLDASKMNRVLYLSCPEPDLNDLKTTAKTLSKVTFSNDVQVVPLNDLIIEGLAVVYLKMCDHLRHHKNQYYFGLRDYYALIKGIVCEMVLKENKQRDLYEIIRHHLSVNFDGIIDGSKFMWSTFCEHMHQEHKISQYSSPTFDLLLHQSLSSRTGRFLMLIGESENVFDYVQGYIRIKYPSLQTRTLIGSTLADDFLSNTTYTEQYNNRVLMGIILHAETDVTLFLRGLGHLYDNLYDLFNQNFAVSAKKKYCRIALGSLYHPRCVIHDNFYCVVFIKQQELEKYDPPFLNRFEKHLIDVNTLIHEHQKTVRSVLIKWINEFLSMKPSENFSCPEHLFIEFSKDYVFNLVADAFDHVPLSDNSNDDQEVIKYCQDQMMRTSSFDFPLLLSLESKNNRNYLIEQYYKIHTDLSFSSFLNQILEQEKLPQLLIYTYTQIYHVIDYSGIPNHQKWIEEVKLSHFKTELELMQKIKMHYQTGSSRLLCVRVDYHQDHVHLPMLKHLLINEQVVDKSRTVCLIFHLQRNKLNQTTNDVFFNGWTRVMIDDLQEHQIIPSNVLLNPSYGDLVIHLNFLNLEATFDELINRCMVQLRYQVTNKHFETKINERHGQIIQQLTSTAAKRNNDDQSLRSIIKNHLLNMIINTPPDSHQTQFKDWRQDLLTNEIIIGSCRSFNDALTKTVLFSLDNYLSLLVAHMEKYSLIDSYLFLFTTNENTYKKLHPIWLSCWTMISKTINMSMINPTNTEIPLIFDLHLPCAAKEYEIIRQIRQTIAQDRQNNDDNWIDFAYKQLISKSIYGSSIDKVFQDSDIFTHYYHDQLTLARNEANIHHLSTSFIQRLISKMSDTIKDQLSYLLIDYGELVEIMRIFEIGIQFIAEEDTVLGVLNKQFIISNDDKEKVIQNSTDLYYLALRESDFYLIPPRSSLISENLFTCTADPFIETSLMNLIELLISPSVIDRTTSIEQLIITYGLFTQSMIKLSRYGHYEVNNLEKFNSFLRLASCISTLFSNDKALVVFKKIYKYSSFCTSFNTLEQIHNFITYLDNVIHQQQSTANDGIIQQTLLKLENELLRNWFIANNDQGSEILQFINDHDLWKYSTKIFTLIDKSLALSSTIRKTNGQVPQNDENKEINQVLGQLNDPARKMEVLMTMRVYTQLILDENYQSQMTDENYQQIIRIFTQNFTYFGENLCQIDDKQNDQRLELISSIAWLRYYIQYYVYALKNDIRDEIMEKIDKLLVENDSAICSTVKLYIIKQLCQFDNITFHELRSRFGNRNTFWIQSMITQPSIPRPTDARRHIVLPTPLFECRDEFMRINEKLTTHITSDQLKDLIHECSTKQDTAYCFIIWFIHYYSRFYINNVSPDDQFVKLIEDNVKEDLMTCFEPLGYQLIFSLSSNFNDNSYFHLNPFMSEEDMHQRLIILNIIALIISFKSLKIPSFLSSLLFDGNLQMPKSYTAHFKKFDSLTGVAVANDSVLIQMINIRTQIDNQMKTHDQSKPKSDILRCSEDCLWLFDVLNYNISNERKQCPLCKKEINISQNEDDTSYIRMNINEALQFISEYIQQHHEKHDLDFESGEEKDIFEKRHHLTQPISYHFFNLLTHAVFLFLNESNFLSNSTTGNSAYYRERVKTHYTLLRKHLSNINQCYIWLYKLINHMMNKNFIITSYLNSPEKLIEEQLILPHLGSVIGEIREYKSVYADFVYGNKKQDALVNFVDELVENDQKYPLLNFFNVTHIHSINIIDDFYSKLHLLPNYEKTYPLTTILLKHLPDYENIQYLYPLIKFTNYLIQKFNHRIERNNAIQTLISQYIKNDSELKKIYQQFLDVWYQINLKEVCFDQRKYLFQRSQSKYDFENKTNISMFLLNKSNDNESILPLACLQTIGNFQNEIVDYFHSHVLNSNDEKYYHPVISIQSIQQKHLFHFDTNQMRKLLVENGSMINFAYGMSEEMIYDYDEIEWTIRNEISCLPSIDLKNIRYFNYQFELYDDNISLISEIREHFEQQLFNDHKRTEMKRFINYLENDFLLQLSGSLEYILTYLRTVNNHNILKTLTFQILINDYIHSRTSINNKFGQEPLASITLEYMIDLYELIEERVFDKILCGNIRDELREKSFNINERLSIVDQFVKMILYNENMATCLKDLNCWISMFKRLLVRLLSLKMNINWDSSLQDYVKRTDMWKENITKGHIQTIEIENNIRLKHAFIILEGLKAKQEEITAIEKHKSLTNSNYGEENDKNTLQTTNSTLRSMNSAQKRKPLAKKDLR